MAAPTCPSCRKAVLPRAENEWYPFCSKRCRAVDLGKWLGEEFRVVDTNADADEDGQPPLPDAPDPDALH